MLCTYGLYVNRDIWFAGKCILYQKATATMCNSNIIKVGILRGTFPFIMPSKTIVPFHHHHHHHHLALLSTFNRTGFLAKCFRDSSTNNLVGFNGCRLSRILSQQILHSKYYNTVHNVEYFDISNLYFTVKVFKEYGGFLLIEAYSNTPLPNMLVNSVLPRRYDIISGNVFFSKTKFACEYSRCISVIKLNSYFFDGTDMIYKMFDKFTNCK